MSKLRTVTGFKSKLEGGGARPNLFEVSLPALPAAALSAGAPVNWTTNEKFNFLCKAAALPASNVAPIDVPFRGRIFKVAGDRTFDTWTVTVINDEDFYIRNAFEAWMNGITKLNNNSGATNPQSYMTNASVYQLGRGAELNKFSTKNNNNNNDNGNDGIIPLKSYTFYDIFPTNISQIDLSYDTSDTIEEFTVEFQVQWWSAGRGNDKDQTAVEIV